MKKYLIGLFVLLACMVQSTDVRIVWNDNPESDNVMYYIVYVSDSNDSTNAVAPIDTVSDIWTGGECTYIYDFQNEYIRAAVQAENINGVGEISDVTRAYSQGEFTVPGKVQMATIPILGN